LSVALVFAPFGAFYSQAFIIQGRDRYLLLTNLIYIAVNISFLLVSFYFFQEVGLALTSVVVHISVFLVPLFFLKKWKML
jgi:O-antigen/teichoic acid export membrane protein